MLTLIDQPSAFLPRCWIAALNIPGTTRKDGYSSPVFMRKGVPDCGRQNLVGSERTPNGKIQAAWTSQPGAVKTFLSLDLLTMLAEVDGVAPEEG